MLLRNLLCLTLGCMTTSVFADTVWLKNGDRLTGKVKVLDGGKLMLETDYGGSIPLDWSKVATLESETPMLVRQDEFSDPQLANSLHKGDDGKVLLGTADAPKAVELASIQQMIQPKPLIQDFAWTGNVDLALDYKRADSDTDDYNVAFSTKAQHGLWRHNGDGEYNRESSDNVTTTNNYQLEYALDRFITEQWFWQGRLDYKHDKIEDLTRQRTLGTGPGYQFWDNELGAFSLTSLINRSDYEYSNGEKDNFYSLAVKWEYNRYLIGQTVELFTNGEIAKPLAGVAEYAFDAEAGLRYKVTDWASLNLKAEKDIVSGSSDGELDETRYTVGFGVGW
jgi:hypothetical protein